MLHLNALLTDPIRFSLFRSPYLVASRPCSPARRTRRATAVSWLLAWLAQRGEPLPDQGPLAQEMPVPSDPVKGHPGDLLIS